MKTPVSDALNAELRAAMRRRGLVAWLDPSGIYTAFADALVAQHTGGQFPHPVIAFRGSWLAWLEALGERPDGADPTPLLVHLPGYTDVTVRETPAFPLVEMSARFERDLTELVRDAAAGQVTPDRIDAFLARGTPTLASADAWLASETTSHDAERAAVYAQVSPDVLLDDLLARSARREAKFPPLRFDTSADVEALAAHLHVAVGMDPAWRSFCATVRGPVRARGTDSPEDLIARQRDRLTEDLIAWVLTVEYVHDLQRPPYLADLVPLRALPELLTQRSKDLAAHLRTHHTSQYPSLADEVETLLREDELKRMKAEELGQIDTFRTEEQVVLRAAMDALRESRWELVRGMVEQRLGTGRSFWVSQPESWSLSRRHMWTLVSDAAALGECLREARRKSTLKASSLEEATETYANDLAAVDRAHRQFEQRLVELLDPRMEHYNALQDVTTRLRALYRAWADNLAREFTALCKSRGFLPESRFQQRTLYEQVVQPYVDRGLRVALFLVDAFRYEMATELADQLRADGRTLDLKPRLAELPTLTVVGMNAIPPVARNGRLDVVREFGGFRAGEFTVSRPDDRARAIGQRSLGKSKAFLLDLAEVCSGSSEKELAKRVAQSKVIVVQSLEIDDAGEAGVGVRTFGSTLRDLAAAWHLLHAAGVDVCVFTADHGFLLQDATTHVQPFGTKRDPQRRYVFDTLPRAEDGMVHVSLASLGYDGLEGYLLFREDTAVFATGNAGATFVHGGNSLQERVIPVLTVEAPREKGTVTQELRVVAEAMTPLLGHHRVRVRVVRSTDATPKLALEKEGAIDVSIRAVGRDDIRAILRDVSGTGTLRSGRAQLDIDADWTECYFALEGERDERAQVEFFHPDNPKRVGGRVVETFFDVAGSVSALTKARGAPARAKPSTAWAEQFEDEGVRAIFLHLFEHGAISETEATAKLGSARAMRRFSAEFDSHAERAPFRVTIEPGADGKRYVKEGDK